MPKTFLLAVSLVVVLLLPSSADAQDKAFFINPACGGNLAAGTMMTWSSVPGADAYYLYVGTQPGSNDLVNTGEIQALSYIPGPLPGGPVYGRIWVKKDSLWRFSDCTFTSTASGAAAFTAPADGAQVSANPAVFAWTPAAGALAYYLYVGTIPGAKDIVDTGEIPQTSYSAALPAGRHLFARIWTKFPGRWLYQDIDVTTVAAAPAMLLAPANGTTIPGGATLFQWTSSPGALAYYLYVGTAVGLKDVIDTGEVSATTLTRPLPVGVRLYARLWTKFADRWDSRDTQFSTSGATWIWPRDGARNVATNSDFKWMPVNGALYDLAVGTAIDRSDVLTLSGLTAATRPQVVLPPDQDLYARLTIHVSGGVRTATIHFRTAGEIPDAWSSFAYPADGMTGVGTSVHIEWTRVSDAQSYYLYIGTRPGAKNVLDYGEVQTTSVEVSSLPPGPLFGRIWTKFASGWKYSDIVFSTVDTGSAALMAYPAAAEANPLNLDSPIQWLPMPGAAAYRLQLGTAAGQANLLDTGSISVTRRFMGGIEAGKRVFGRLGALVNGQWVWTSFAFTTGSAAGDRTPRIDAALALTGQVRAMADAANVPVAGSVLARIVSDSGALTAQCTHYSAALIQLLREMDGGLAAGFINVCLNTSNLFDCHTVVGVTDPSRGMALVLDPTMGFAPVRLSTRQYASADDIGAAAAAQSFGDLGFHFVSPQTDAWARGYYLDYPLLYLSRAAQHSPLELMEQVGTSVTGPTDLYAVQCVDGTATAFVNGTAATLPCAGTDHLTYVFFAGSIAPANGSRIVVWRPRRFVFLN